MCVVFLAIRYHCHTCKMVDRYGVCSICARVCHANCDVTYAKHGSFFCDCGAKEDGSCKALVKRTTASSSLPSAARSFNTSSATYETVRATTCAAGAAVDATVSTKEKNDDVKAQQMKKKISLWADVVTQEIRDSGVISDVLELQQSLTPVVETMGHR